MSKLEDLPDEILIEICLYLTSIDTLNAFGYLNTRIERTITQFRSDIDYQYLTHSQFQRFTSIHLSYNAEYIRKLTFNCWYTPGAISSFHQLTQQYEDLHEFLPLLEQINLFYFNNRDVDILRKILSIETVCIEFDSQVPLLYSTQTQLDHYLFCVPNSIKDLRLYGSERGLSLKHYVSVRPSKTLEKLIISVSTLDDLILLFRRAPFLTKLHVEINRFDYAPPRQYAAVNIMPKHLKDFQLWLKDKQILLFQSLYVLLINMPSIERLGLEIESDDIEYASGFHWKELLTDLPNLSHFEMGLKLSIGFGNVPIDVTPHLETFSANSIDVCCYADTHVLYIDTIPYNFNNPVGIMTSPRASQAQSTNSKVFKQTPRNVSVIYLNGRHQATSTQDWLTVIQRFPRVRAVDLMSINVTDELASDYPVFQLSNLTVLRLIRSTKCNINLSLFLYLTNQNVTPRLRTLTTMYGDLIYLCKRLSDDLSFQQIKELCIYAHGADGRIRLKDLDLLLKYFPNLEYVWFNLESSRTINKYANSIIEKLLFSIKNLICLRIVVKKHFLRMPNSQTIERLCQIDNCDQVKIINDKKEFSIWKK